MNVTLQVRTASNPPQVYVQCGGITCRNEDQMEQLIQTLRTAKAWLRRQTAPEATQSPQTNAGPLPPSGNRHL